MKYTTMSYTFSRQEKHFDLGKMLKFTAEHMDGIDFVTLHGQEASELKKMSDDFGVDVVCHTFFARGLPSEDLQEQREALDECKKGIEAAVRLGAPVIMIPTPGQNMNRDQLRKRWILGLKSVIPLTNDAGLMLSIENFPGDRSPFVLADDYQEAKREIPELKLTFDSGNAGSGEDPAESFRQCADNVVHAHFKDWVISEKPQDGYRPMLDGRFYRSALIGEGDIDNRSCVKAMKEAGYDGYINIEYENDKYDPFEATRRAVEYLRQLEAEI